MHLLQTIIRFFLQTSSAHPKQYNICRMKGGCWCCWTQI